MYLVRAFLGAAIAVVGLSAPSQAVLVNFTDADPGFGAGNGATTVDFGTLSSVARDPATAGDGDAIDSIVYTLTDPSFGGGSVEVTVSVSSTSTPAGNVLDEAGSSTRFEIGRLVAGQDVTLSGAITSFSGNVTSASFLGFSTIDFTSLSGGEDTTITSGAATTPVLDSGASSDIYDLADEFAGVTGDPGTYTSFTLNHVGSSGNTGSWGLRDWDFSIEFTAVPEPSTFTMLGLCGLVCSSRRRNR